MNRSYDTNSEDANINRLAEFANRTGLCPVCRVRESAMGITCGDWSCLNHWLPGGDKSIPVNTVSL